MPKVQNVAYSDGSIGREIVKGTPPPAQTIGATYSIIQINSGYNWINPDDTYAYNVTTKTVEKLSFLQTLNTALGTQLSPTEYRSLILLHEFRHVLGAPTETDLVEFNKEIVSNCLQ
jgi:hypothetical protein